MTDGDIISNIYDSTSYIDTTSNVYDFNSDITFGVAGNHDLIRLCENGDIYIKGKLVTNDLDVVNGMRIFLTETKEEYCKTCNRMVPRRITKSIKENVE